MKYLHDRFRNLNSVFLMGMVTLVLTACGPAADKEEQAVPNFVLIYTDEMEFNDLGCYGGDIPTPNIDQMRPTPAAVRT